MNKLKEYACEIRKVLPRVRIGVLEWDVPEVLGEALHCRDNQQTIFCRKNANGDIVCVIPQRELDTSSQILRDAF